MKDQRPKGTKDMFGYQLDLKNLVIKNFEEITKLFNYQKIETPIFEKSSLFVKSVGETSDVVTKEMYTFKDKGDRSMTLRPEGTAGTIRAIIENKLYTKLPLKVYYSGPMFRYENPQKGRQRQFNQCGVEVISPKSPLLDAEVILTASTFLNSLNIPFSLEINSLGDKHTRDSWSRALKDYFSGYRDQLTQQSQDRIDKNPIRILDDKIEGKKDFVVNAPKIKDYYSEDSLNYFKKLTNFLTGIGVKYIVNEKLVRGFDYYTDTAFEFISVSSKAGSQSTIIGGGRYDNLMKNSGGPDLSGVGFGVGIERIMNDLESQILPEEIKQDIDVFVMNISKEFSSAALSIVYFLRRYGITTDWNYQPLKINKAFEKADKSGAFIKVIAGPKELKNNKVVVKFNKKQKEVNIDELPKYIDKLKENNERNK